MRTILAHISRLEAKAPNRESAKLPVYEISLPQDAKKIGFLNLARELRNSIYFFAILWALANSRKMVALYLFQFTLVSKQLDYEFLEALMQFHIASGGLCFRRHQIIDARGGLGMVQFPLRFISAAIQCQLTIKKNMVTTTNSRRNSWLIKTSRILGEALGNASRLKVLRLSLIGSGGEKELFKSDTDVKLLMQNLRHVTTLTTIMVEISESVWWRYELVEGEWTAKEKAFRKLERVKGQIQKIPPQWTWVVGNRRKSISYWPRW